MKVALLICDGGDGSASIHFYKDIEEAKRLCDEDEWYYMNEGSPTVIEVPDNWTPSGGWGD